MTTTSPTESPLAQTSFPLLVDTRWAILAGLCASLVGIGLARFAYTPLIPALIEAHWFSPSQSVSLGAANFVGYLLGALLGRRLAAGIGNRRALRLLMLIASAAFFACAYPLSIAWFFSWRLLSGISGGAIMVLVATTILPHVPPSRRGLAGGVIFLGVGLGIAASGSLVPLLLHNGLKMTWIGLGGLALLLTLTSWFGWPVDPPANGALPDMDLESAKPSFRPLAILYGQYAANALGIVPAMILLVDYVARGLHQGAAMGANYWVGYGIAACLGPILAGSLADRIGFRQAYRFALLLQAAADGLLVVSGHPLALFLATLILGAFTPGIVPLALGRIQEILPDRPQQQRAAWSLATTAFALFQAVGGYGYSYLFAHYQENYRLIFLCGSLALVLALLADLIRQRRHRPI